jgi:phospholipid/cholesterol/gamma-HCH transport system substrate-binding protein
MEKPNSRGENNFIVGMFVFVALMVMTGFIVFIGGTGFFQGEYTLKIRFEDARGLNVGAPVYMSGILIGRVSSKGLPKGEKGVDVSLSVSKKFKEHLRQDSLATTTTTGMLGDQVVVVSPGTESFDLLKDGDFLKRKDEKKLEDYLATGGNAVESLAKAAFQINVMLEAMNKGGRIEKIMSNLETMTGTLSSGKEDSLTPAIKSLNRILAKVEKGEGTLGALINDPTLHEDMKILLGGAKRSKIIRFMVRETIAQSEEKKASK